MTGSLAPELPGKGDPRGTADSKVRKSLITLRDGLNAILTGENDIARPVVTHTAKTIASEETRTSTSFGTLTTADEVKGVVVPEGGLLVVRYRALWKNSVAGAGRATIFLNGEELQMPVAPTGGPGSTPAIGPAKANTFGYLATSSQGLRGPLTERPAASFGSGPETLGVYDNANLEIGLAPTEIILPAAGTYVVSVRYSATSGSVTAKQRSLRVLVLAF